MKRALCVAVLFPLLACEGEAVAGPRLALRDPQGILDEVNGDLRLLAFSADDYACNAGSGLLSPAPPDSQEIEASSVDVDFPIGEPVSVKLPPGDYVVLVRGRGDDVDTGRTNVLVATGCAAATVVKDRTATVTIEMLRQIVPGVCGDGVLSPNEQCEDGNTEDRDECSADCRSEATQLNLLTPEANGPQSLSAAGWTAGTRLGVAFLSQDDVGVVDLRLRLLSEAGAPIDSPAALRAELPVHPTDGVQTEPWVAIVGDAIAVVYTDASIAAGPDLDIRYDRYDFNGTERASFDVSGVATGEVARSRIAAQPDGRSMIVFLNRNSPTGLRARIVEANADGPLGDDSFEVGEAATKVMYDLTSVHLPYALAAREDGFTLVWSPPNGEMWVRRFDDAGEEVGAAFELLGDVASNGDLSEPDIVTLDDGRSIVVWTENGPEGDGDGSTIRGRFLGADGRVEGVPFTVNSTTAGDQIGARVAALGDRFVVAFTSGDEIRARIFALDGTPELNRELEPTNLDFRVAGPNVSEPSLAAGGDGRFIVTWTQDGNIGGRVFALP